MVSRRRRNQAPSRTIMTRSHRNAYCVNCRTRLTKSEIGNICDLCKRILAPNSGVSSTASDRVGYPVGTSQGDAMLVDGPVQQLGQVDANNNGINNGMTNHNFVNSYNNSNGTNGFILPNINANANSYNQVQHGVNNNNVNGKHRFILPNTDNSQGAQGNRARFVPRDNLSSGAQPSSISHAPNRPEFASYAQNTAFVNNRGYMTHVSSPVAMSPPATGNPPGTMDAVAANNPASFMNAHRGTSAPMTGSPPVAMDSSAARRASASSMNMPAPVTRSSPMTMNSPAANHSPVTNAPAIASSSRAHSSPLLVDAPAGMSAPASTNAQVATSSPMAMDPPAAQNVTPFVNPTAAWSPSVRPASPAASDDDISSTGSPETMSPFLLADDEVESLDAEPAMTPPATFIPVAALSVPLDINFPAGWDMDNPVDSSAPMPAGQNAADAQTDAAMANPTNLKQHANFARYEDLIADTPNYSDMAAAAAAASDEDKTFELAESTRDLLTEMEAMVAKRPSVLQTGGFVSDTPTGAWCLLPPRNLAIYLLDLYRDDVFFLYPFVNWAMFMLAFDQMYQAYAASSAPFAHWGLGFAKEAGPSSPLFQCALYMMLSHAVFFSNLTRADKALVSSVFWKCAKSFIAWDLIGTGTLSSVQVFLIMSVFFHSSRLPSMSCKVPAELACRIAVTLGLDNDKQRDRKHPWGPDEQFIHRQAWYGCVMMNLFSHTPINSDLTFRSNVCGRPLLPRDYPETRGVVDVNFFLEIIIRGEHLEEHVARGRSGKYVGSFPHDGYDNFGAILHDLRASLVGFIRTLPDKMSRGRSGLPSETRIMDGPASRKAECNAWFMHLRAMLFRPIIMQKGLAEVLASRSDLTKAQADTLIKAKTLLCARACLNAALRLIALLWRTFDTQAPGDWWWDPHYTSIAALILIVSQKSDPLMAHVNRQVVLGSWRACYRMLAIGFKRDDIHREFYREFVSYLVYINRSIPRIERMLPNYFLPDTYPPKAPTNASTASRTASNAASLTRALGDGPVFLPPSSTAGAAQASGSTTTEMPPPRPRNRTRTRTRTGRRPGESGNSGNARNVGLMLPSSSSGKAPSRPPWDSGASAGVALSYASPYSISNPNGAGAGSSGNMHNVSNAENRGQMPPPPAVNRSPFADPPNGYVHPLIAPRNTDAGSPSSSRRSPFSDPHPGGSSSGADFRTMGSMPRANSIPTPNPPFANPLFGGFSNTGNMASPGHMSNMAPSAPNPPVWNADPAGVGHTASVSPSTPAFSFVPPSSSSMVQIMPPATSGTMHSPPVWNANPAGVGYTASVSPSTPAFSYMPPSSSSMVQIMPPATSGATPSPLLSPHPGGYGYGGDFPNMGNMQPSAPNLQLWNTSPAGAGYIGHTAMSPSTSYMAPSTPSFASNMSPSSSGMIQNMPPSTPAYSANQPPSSPGMVQNRPSSASSAMSNAPATSVAMSNMPTSTAGAVSNLPLAYANPADLGNFANMSTIGTIGNLGGTGSLDNIGGMGNMQDFGNFGTSDNDDILLEVLASFDNFEERFPELTTENVDRDARFPFPDFDFETLLTEVIDSDDDDDEPDISQMTGNREGATVGWYAAL